MALVRDECDARVASLGSSSGGTINSSAARSQVYRGPGVHEAHPRAKLCGGSLPFDACWGSPRLDPNAQPVLHGESPKLLKLLRHVVDEELVVTYLSPSLLKDTRMSRIGSLYPAAWVGVGLWWFYSQTRGLIRVYSIGGMTREGLKSCARKHVSLHSPRMLWYRTARVLWDRIWETIFEDFTPSEAVEPLCDDLLRGQR